MATWNVIRAMVGLDAGRACRTCTEPLTTADPFGMSESVCRSCRAKDT